MQGVVLAEAVQRKDSSAIYNFENECKSFSIAMGTKINPRVAEDPDDWWYRFLDHLGGYSKPPGALAGFHGHCGLKYWLGTVARRFANDSGRPRRGGQRNREGPEGEQEEENKASKQKPWEEECVELLAGFLRKALDRLDNRAQAVLSLLYGEGLCGPQVATIYQVHKGTVTRWREKAVSLLRDALEQQAARLPHSETYEDCVEAVMEGGGWVHLVSVVEEHWEKIEGDAKKTGKEASPGSHAEEMK